MAPDVVGFADEGRALLLSNGAALPIPPAPGEYPAVARLIPTSGSDGVDVGHVSFDTSRLVRFTKNVYPLRGSSVGLTFTFYGGVKPVAVTVNGLDADEFTGLLCPLRVAS